MDWSAPVFGYRFGRRSEDLTRDVRDSARGIPKGVVVDAAFDWGHDRPPERADERDDHLRDARQGAHDAPSGGAPELRGTYAGLACPPVVDYLKWLGVTAVELMPVHHFVNDKFLLDRGLTNYWGYNSIGYFAPESRYAAAGEQGQQVARVQGDGEGAARRRAWR